jgi:hypothetical protein
LAGKYGPSSVTVTLEDGPGGTARNIENFILNGISAKDMSEMMETHALGDAWKERTPIGIKDGEDITLEGIWDTTATTGTHAVLGTVDDGPQDDGRELVVVFGDAKTWTRDVRLAEYEVVADLGSIQQFRALLTPTGAAVWS